MITEREGGFAAEYWLDDIAFLETFATRTQAEEWLAGMVARFEKA